MSNLDRTPQEVPCPAVATTALPEEMTLLPRDVPLGGPRAMTVRRTLPHRDIRTVGAWCFIDDYGPAAPQDPPMNVRPHPHMGLQTVSWLLAGEIEHRDSLGSHAFVHPGELNLMTAGYGISHSEYATEAAGLRGIQMWIALPQSQRHRPPAFEQHTRLPTVEVAAGDSAALATVFLGSFAGAHSPATVYTPILGVQVVTAADVALELPLRSDFEHAVLALDHPLVINGTSVPSGGLYYLGCGSSRVAVISRGDGPFLLLGGEPLNEDLLMWWNFVGRSHEEVVEARNQWESGTRFGVVRGDPHEPLPAPALPGATLRPRPGRTTPR